MKPPSGGRTGVKRRAAQAGARRHGPLRSVHLERPADDGALHAIIADQARETANLAAQLEKKQRLLHELLRIQQLISSSAPVDSILEEIVASATALIGDEAGNLRLQDPRDPRRLILGGRVSDPTAAIAKVDAIRVGEGATGRAFSEERLVVIEDYAHARGTNPSYGSSGLEACMAAPVRQNGRVIGVMVVATQRKGRTYSRDEQEILLAFAEHASLALTDAQRVSAVEHLAFHDSLTGLVNRAHFMERLAEALTRARQSRQRVGVLFIDLNDFKIVNDSLGHAVGDQLLEVVGRRLAEATRAYDVAGRLGGDEFAVLLENAGSDDDVSHIVQRLQSHLNAPAVVAGHSISVTASVGVAMSDGSDDAAELLRNADLAMYAAKTRKDGRPAAYEGSMHTEAVSRMRAEEELRTALAAGQFDVHYQAIVALDSGEVHGLEALLRWHHPVRGLTAPVEFIRVAEETGLIVPMGRWVLETACAQMAAWRRQPFAQDLTLSVNVSARQLLRAELVAEVTSALQASGLAPSALTLEITESALLEDSAAVRERVATLKGLGVGFALDDFGTGYSSLSHLHQLPIDVVKIDRAFVSDLGTTQKSAAMAAAIVGLTRALRLTVVAEGIECATQADELLLLGCRLGQGYYFGHPMSAAAVQRVLEAWAERRAVSSSLPTRAVVQRPDHPQY